MTAEISTDGIGDLLGTILAIAGMIVVFLMAFFPGKLPFDDPNDMTF